MPTVFDITCGEVGPSVREMWTHLHQSTMQQSMHSTFLLLQYNISVPSWQLRKLDHSFCGEGILVDDSHWKSYSLSSCCCCWYVHAYVLSAVCALSVMSCVQCRHGHIEAAAALLNEGSCSPNVTNDNGSTPLHIAAQHGNVYVVELLLSHQELDVVRCLMLSLTVG